MYLPSDWFDFDDTIDNFLTLIVKLYIIYMTKKCFPKFCSNDKISIFNLLYVSKINKFV